MPHTILITGATSGIGHASANVLARHADTLILLGRNANKLRHTAAGLSANHPACRIETVVADLSEPASIEAVIPAITAITDRIDVLLNNAGAYFPERVTNSAGFEQTFALNHLGYYHLTIRLWPLLTAAGKSRVVNVSSGAHTMGKIHWDDLMLSQGYSGMKAYAQSKLANILFTVELAERGKAIGLTSNSLHPGVVATEFANAFSGPIANLLLPLAKRLMITPEKGAETSVFLASDPNVAGMSGQYFVKKRVAKASPAAMDRADAKRLWEVSEELVKTSLSKS